MKKFFSPKYYFYKFKILRNNRLIKKYGPYDKRTFNSDIQLKNFQNLTDLGLCENSLFIDGGSHRGEELSYLVDIGCHVHGFEIHPEHFKNLKAIYGKNKKITLNNKGIGTQKGTQKAYFKRKSKLASMSLFREKDNINEKEYISIEIIDIADYIEKLSAQVDVLKLDIEGGEFEIIEHLIRTGTINKIKYIFFEDHLSKFKNSDEWKRKRLIVKNLIKAQKYENKFYEWF